MWEKLRSQAGRVSSMHDGTENVNRLSVEGCLTVSSSAMGADEHALSPPSLDAVMHTGRPVEGSVEGSVEVMHGDGMANRMAEDHSSLAHPLIHPLKRYHADSYGQQHAGAPIPPSFFRSIAPLGARFPTRKGGRDGRRWR